MSYKTCLSTGRLEYFIETFRAQNLLSLDYVAKLNSSEYLICHRYRFVFLCFKLSSQHRRMCTPTQINLLAAVELRLELPRLHLNIPNIPETLRTWLATAHKPTSLKTRHKPLRNYVVAFFGPCACIGNTLAILIVR